MRYFITIIFACVSICLGLMVAWTVQQGITDSWEWFLVGVGILIPNVVSVLITISAYSAAKDY